MPVELPKAYDFFADAQNLERLTPEFLKFKILTPAPIDMRKGARIAYSISLFGLPMKWLTEISEWHPPTSFVDTQLRGPYRMWIHEHILVPSGESTIVRDRVTFKVAGGPLEPLIFSLFVRRTLERIFRYRQEAMSRFFSPSSHT